MTSPLQSQRFCLRWNNHQSNLLSVFDQLLHDESFVDVTLAVEGRLLRAHKMVLSACSPYFQALFVGHPDKHPIVILKDVPYCDMRSLLDFMYRGEVSVDQDRLTAFLKVAESLRIKGLTEVNEERCDIPSIRSSLLSSVPPPVVTTHTPPPPPHLHRIHPVVPTAQKRSASAATVANPLLGSALTAPKRKRGRPRKLSGSSGGAPANLPGDNPVGRNVTQPLLDGNGELESQLRIAQVPDSLVQGSPEHLEVNFQHSPATTPASSVLQRQNEGENGHESGGVPSPEDEKSSVKDVPIQQVKEEPEPTPGPSSQDPDEAFARPNDASRDPTESFALDSSYRCADHPSVTFEICRNSTTFHHSGGHVSIHQEDLLTHETKIEPLEDSLSDSTAGVHFLSGDGTDEEGHGCIVVTRCDETNSDDLLSEAAATVAAGVNFGIGTTGGNPRGKHDLLEYQPQEDGSVVCKWCGEVLPSRTHWYRHKYKMHVPTTVPPPANLFKCHHCNVFFKSRKGYIGHMASRHGEDETAPGEGNGESGSGSTTVSGGTTTRKKGNTKSEIDVPWGADYKKQREREEKLVADIIDRVRRECEAQGATMTRRGYSRRTTVMNS